jgi:hypothetical protein
MSDFILVGDDNLQPSQFSQGRTSDISAAERDLRSLQRVGLTKDGRAWLTAALDPFHDLALEVNGYPDYSSLSTITQVVKRQITIQRPSTLPIDAIWDCHIFSTPLDTSLVDVQQRGVLGGTLIRTQPGQNLQANDPLASGALGTVTAVACATGGLSLPTATSLCSNDNRFWCLSPSEQQYYVAPPAAPNAKDQFCDGLHRVIATGFEVVNTTPQLFRGGAVTAYYQEQFPTTFVGGTIDTNDPTGIFNTFRTTTAVKLPPSTVNEAILLPESRQWAASDGSYSVVRQNGVINSFQQPTPTQLLLAPDFLNISQQSPPPFAVVPFGNCAPQGNNDSGLPLMITLRDVGCSGVYYTGLHPNTTLTLNARFIIERAPTSSESNLVVLARPSPEEDPIAFLLYSEAIRRMPPGVRLRDNAMGAWFRSTVGAVKSAVMPAVQRGLPHLGNALQDVMRGMPPQAALARAAVNAIEDVAKSRPSTSNQPRKQRVLTRTNSTKEQRQLVQFKDTERRLQRKISKASLRKDLRQARKR